jgi:hypothetical protein
MKKLIISSLVIIIFFLFSCEKETINHDSIIGQWQWIMTSYGDFGFPITPESVDSTYYIEFNNNGHYYLRDNSKKQIFEQKYELEQSSPIKTLKFEDFAINGIIYGYSISHDTLSIWIPAQLRSPTNLFTRLK